MNTGGCDRVASELLWLSLWQGPERRVHVLTDTEMSQWVVSRYQGLQFPYDIVIYHYNYAKGKLAKVGHLRT